MSRCRSDGGRLGPKSTPRAWLSRDTFRTRARKEPRQAWRLRGLGSFCQNSILVVSFLSCSFRLQGSADLHTISTTLVGQRRTRTLALRRRCAHAAERSDSARTPRATACAVRARTAELSRFYCCDLHFLAHLLSSSVTTSGTATCAGGLAGQIVSAHQHTRLKHQPDWKHTVRRSAKS